MDQPEKAPGFFQDLANAVAPDALPLLITFVWQREQSTPEAPGREPHLRRSCLGTSQHHL